MLAGDVGATSAIFLGSEFVMVCSIFGTILSVFIALTFAVMKAYKT
jgi:hypothetical protein